NANPDTNCVIFTGIVLNARNLLNISAPIIMKKMAAVRRVVSLNDFLKSSKLNLLVITVNRKAPNAPTPPASVGVKYPKYIPPILSANNRTNGQTYAKERILTENDFFSVTGAIPGFLQTRT